MLHGYRGPVEILMTHKCKIHKKKIKIQLVHILKSSTVLVTTILVGGTILLCCSNNRVGISKRRQRREQFVRGPQWPAHGRTDDQHRGFHSTQTCHTARPDDETLRVFRFRFQILLFFFFYSIPLAIETENECK